MSQLRNSPPRILIEISSLLLSTDFNYRDPYDDYEKSEELLENSSKWASVDVDSLDVEFISSFIFKNEKLIESVNSDGVNPNEIISRLIIPEMKEYRVSYEIWGPAVLTEKYSTTRQSYGESFARNSLRHEYHEGKFDYYQGNYEEHETDNFDADHFEITWVESLNESKKSIISRLVIENTSEVLNDLDKRTLIELRNLINQKLSSF
jgi:hypothetical protein